MLITFQIERHERAIPSLHQLSPFITGLSRDFWEEGINFQESVDRCNDVVDLLNDTVENREWLEDILDLREKIDMEDNEQ